MNMTKSNFCEGEEITGLWEDHIHGEIMETIEALLEETLRDLEEEGKKERAQRKNYFQVGEWVKVFQGVEFGKEYDKKKKCNVRKAFPVVFDEPRIGQIVGVKRRFTGEIYPGSGGYDPSYGGYDYDPPYLNPEKSHIVWLVQVGYLNKPIEAFEKDVSLLDYEEIPEDLPWQYQTWTKEDRERLSDWMRQEVAKRPELFPRDEKGRFKRLDL
jgi:hypothetical protein